MSASFSIQPIGRFVGASQPVKRPKEFACFSYDDNHQFHLDDSSIKYYYTPQLGADLSKGFESFEKQDDSKDEHLDSLLKTIMAYEEEQGKKIDANVVTWRGMMTKYWGYKFETLSTLPAPWGETSREFIEGRENQVVNNNEQYCSVVRTGIGKNVLCLGGEVDAIWDTKPQEKGSPINWVELKTSVEIRGPNDLENFHRKLMKYWIQSFLLGVPKIIVGFRTREGILVDVNEIETQNIPATVGSRPNPSWDADMCVNFAGVFLEWLTEIINDEGVWRIRRLPQAPTIEVFKVEETGHGDILSDEFKNWRIKLALKSQEGT
ncbi:decapping endonuclease targeting mRNA [Amphichorda felina]